jgi:hypothetical protein
VGVLVSKGIATGTDPSEWVISKWGDEGEYRHRIDDVPAVYGAATEFWTDRKKV